MSKKLFMKVKIKKLLKRRKWKFEENFKSCHTFGHAYEASNKYNKNLNHGEAVILGIISSAKFSLLNRILSQSIYDKIIDHVKNLTYLSI